MKIVSKLMMATLAASAINSTPVIACDANPFIGEVCPVAFTFAPRGWAFTNGQLLAISNNNALFSIVGTIYGGDGRTTFGLPDTRGRVVIGAGQGPGLSNYPIGARGGADSVTLTSNQIGVHSHSAATTVSATTDITVAAQINVSSSGANKGSPAGNVLAVAPGANNLYRAFDANVPQVAMNAASINYSIPLPISATAGGITNIDNFSGGSQSHENRMPVHAINWVIALVGTYPSRN
jgi:microcystin-dependent protein